MNQLHYPSLELCKKLTEAGFPAEYPPELYVRPSVMELLDDMPIKIKIQWIVYYELPSWWFISWSPNGIDTYDFNWILPNALAEMWLWLKENKFISTKNKLSPQ